MLALTAPVFAAAVGGMAAATLALWVGKQSESAEAVRGIFAMKVNTALGLFLLAVSLVGMWRGGRSFRNLSSVCAGGAVFLGAAMLLEHVGSLDLRIDQFLLDDATEALLPGRISISMAMTLVLMGVAYWLNWPDRAPRVSHPILLIALVIPLAALGGYIYDAPDVSHSLRSPLIAMHNALCAGLLCIGGLFVRSDAGMMKLLMSDTGASAIARRLLPAAIVLPMLLGAIILSVQRAGVFSSTLAFAVLGATCSLMFAGAVWLTTSLMARSEAKKALADDQRRRAERQMLEGQQRLRIAVETAKLGTWDFNMQTGVFACSAQCRINFGLSPEAVFDYPALMAAIEPEDRDRVEAAIKCARGGVEDYREEYRARWPDGSIHPILTSGRVLMDESGTPARMVGVTLDLTDLRQAEESLKQLNATLEQQVQERSRALERNEVALRQAQKMESLGQLTGGLAHDFNNLLAGIRGSLELLQRRVQQQRYEDLDKYIGIAKAASDRGASLTQSLLAFARKQTLAPVAFNVNSTIANMGEMLDRTLGPDVRFRFELTEGLQPILCDAAQLESALLNLCINARDAMPGGGVLTISTTHCPTIGAADAVCDRGGQIGVFVCIAVHDTGLGMSEEVRTRVFDPFFTTKPAGKGTGLGLSMVYGFAKQSGGDVRIESSVGAGTVVTICLPAFEGQVPMVSSDGTIRTVEHRSSASILVVDDEPSVRAVLTDMLHELGHVVIEAEDGPSAIQIVESECRIDLLISDVGLPNGLNGRQVIDRARLRRPNLPALIVTGYAESTIFQEAPLPSDVPIMKKPFSFEELSAKVSARLGAT